MAIRCSVPPVSRNRSTSNAPPRATEAASCGMAAHFSARAIVGPDRRGGPVVLHQRTGPRRAAAGCRTRPAPPGPLVAAALNPAVDVRERGAGHGGGQQEAGQAHGALLLKPGQVPVTGRVPGEPVSHAEGHQLVGADAEEVPDERRTVSPPTPSGLNRHDRPIPRASRRPLVSRSMSARVLVVRTGPGMADDPVGQLARLVRARGRQDEHLELHSGVQAPEVLGPAEADSEVGGRPGEAQPAAQARPGPAAGAQRGQPAPAQPSVRAVTRTRGRAAGAARAGTGSTGTGASRGTVGRMTPPADQHDHGEDADDDEHRHRVSG